MKKIGLVTDSTADLPESIIEKYDINIIPLKIKFSDQEIYDREITEAEFYSRLEKDEDLPITSQPSPNEFYELYEKLLEEYQEIISIHLSSRLSGTLNSAHMAKNELDGDIHIIDSKNISLGLGLLVIEAARNIKNNLETSRIISILSEAKNNIETLFTLDTLDYLQKGGRIGKVQNIVGSFLNIKPVIRVGKDGIYHTYSKTRGQKKALEKIVTALVELSKDRKKVQLAVAHGAAEKAGLFLKNTLENTFQMEATFTQVGPVIGVHTGPGTVGAAIHYK